MKRSFHFRLISTSVLLLASLLFGQISLIAQTTLYDTNLIVVRVGNGVQAPSSTGNSIFLDQFTTNGSYVSTLALPDSGPSAVMIPISNPMDGCLTRSADNRLLTLAVYASTPGSNLYSSSSVPQAVLNVDGFGNLQLPALDTTAFNSWAFHCAVTDGTNNHWGIGQIAGVVYLGNASPKATVESAQSGCRIVDIFNGDLYMSTDGSGGIYKFSGLPVTSTTLPSPIIFTNYYTSGKGIAGFAVNPANTIIYCADARAYSTNAGGIQRWDYDNVKGVWVNSYHLTNGLPGDGLQNLTVDWTGPAPTVYATTVGATGTKPTSIVRVSDNGSSSLFATLATSGTNRVYRGIKFGPLINAPVVMTPPTNQYSAIGGSVTFSARASGLTPLNYQWQLSSTNISGATDSSLTISNIQFADAGTYRVIVTNSAGTATSLSATLSLVTNAPIITSYTTNTIKSTGATATLTVTAASTGPVTYQWFFDNVPIAGATTSTLNIPNIQFSNVGSYYVYASNLYSFASNGPALVGAFTGPQSRNVPAGGTLTFATQVAGPLTPTYQWRVQTTNIAQGTASILTITNFQITNIGYYNVVCTVSNISGTSGPAFVGIIYPQTNNPPGSIPAPAGLINWWPFEGNFKDGFGTYDATPRTSIPFVPAECGYGCSFNGAMFNYLSVDAPPVTPPWTASFWVNRLDAPSSSASLIGDGVTGLKLEQYNGTRKVGITKFGTPGGDYVFNYSVPTNTWVHLLLVGTETNTSVYANGVLQDTITNVINLPRGQIGADLGGGFDFARGTYDEIMLFNRALDPQEILAIYNAGSAGILRAPEFLPSSASAAQFTTTIRGLTGKTISLYGSSNLLDWTFLNAYTNTNGLLPFADEFQDSSTPRFYKATQQ